MGDYALLLLPACAPNLRGHLFHKELQADLRALAEKHPALGDAIAAAKKAKKTR